MCQRMGLLTVFLLSANCLATNENKQKPFNVGTVLFRDIDVARDCWSKEEIALINSRRIMQDLIPREIMGAETDAYVPAILDYFEMCVDSIWKKARGRARHLLLLALADVFGGFLHVYALPFTKQRYYSGVVRYEYAKRLYDLYNDLKTFLMTNGGNWRKPRREQGKGILIKPLYVLPTKSSNACARLITFHKDAAQKQEISDANYLSQEKVKCKHHKNSKHKDNQSPPANTIIPMPFLDDSLEPNVVAVPFKDTGMSLLGLESAKSACILEIYYVASMRCLMSIDASPESTMIMKLEYYRWLKTEVVPHLQDEKWYPAFGGVLKIVETLNKEGIGNNDFLVSEFYNTRNRKTHSQEPNFQDQLRRLNGKSSISKISETFMWPSYLRGKIFIVIATLVVLGVVVWCCVVIYCLYSRCCKKKRSCDPECPDKPVDSDSSSRLFNTVVQVMYSLRNNMSATSREEGEQIDTLPPLIDESPRTQCPMMSPRCKKPPQPESGMLSTSQEFRKNSTQEAGKSNSRVMAAAPFSDSDISSSEDEDIAQATSR